MGARLTYSGAGSVNGVGGYQFLLSTVAQEQAADNLRRFRIRIWRQPAGAPAQVVYDNLDDETGSGGSRGAGSRGALRRPLGAGADPAYPTRIGFLALPAVA